MAYHPGPYSIFPLTSWPVVPLYSTRRCLVLAPFTCQVREDVTYLPPVMSTISRGCWLDLKRPVW